jgi:glyoxylase-like metal-dependent hydrolase (beta-lactamase superfamily II)
MNPLPHASLSRRDALKFLGLAGGLSLAAPGWLAAAGEKPAPPGLGGDQAGYHRFKIGDFEALALFDGGFAPPSDGSPFGVDEAPGAVAATLEAALLPGDRVHLPFNVLLVRAGSELVLVDAGAGAAMGPAGGKMFAALARAGVRPEQITGVILTHAHGDHCGGLVDAEKRAVFPNARLFVGRKEHEFWMASSPDLSGMAVPPDAHAGFVLTAQTAIGAYRDRLELVKGGDRILEGFELLDTAGHTPGHLAVLVASGKDQLLHFADVAHHHAISFAHPGWRFAYDADPGLAAETRRKLLDRAAADRLRLFGTHMPFPCLGRARKTANAYEFVPEPFMVG